ncbi:acyl-CoA dehydrogenase family protein [Tepidiforma sp.]|jgi:alkylation response protein AidB-like acyl-CoA dehydrogenase|uniref:acyl-CoA dehydrogenase family protein n=1 Tax=Tepidiforma sp. TaxID=2682230 RepID=UPI0021DDB8AC|nr:acyl-CoA dehydrogenase family protein [Tepidiforma sp.]MCX7617470.1 acyl-CoA dehydrogenase family protein [Tepidiforma sp.]GIW17526.1 MAG: acyl-CoA dehydrogenase [Tepidiforma sp.]
MLFRDSPEHAAFRAEVRAFLDAELPRETWDMRNDREEMTPEEKEFTRQFRKKLAARGWLTMGWPREFGGAGASYMTQTVYMEEMSSAGAPGAYDQGVWLAGPALMMHGTSAQQQRWLPGMRTAEDHWCQLFSEPGAGSDLASLQTRAVRDGDVYVINGQKIWTSGAQEADWGILLARTDPEAPKHRGISYFMVDMRLPGITVRPLVNLMGSHHFCEVFFDDVRVPADCLVGEENRGWYIATTTLDQERSSINRVVMTRSTLYALIDYVREHPHLRRGEIRHELAERYLEFEIGRWLCYRVAQMQSEGKVPNAEASVSKIFGTELQRQMGITGLRVLGLPGQLEPGSRWAPLRGRVERWALAAPSYTIAGGTSEVNRNIIATRGLGLPRG